MRRLSPGVVLAATLSVTFLAGSARALIVVDGKIVPAWPAANPVASEGAQLAATNIGLYPDPKGTVLGLTLLIDFSDAGPAFTKQQVEAWLNQRGYEVGGLNGSVRDYFADQSNGMVDFQNEVFGFYRAKQPKSYYEAKSGYSGSDELFAEMLDYFDDTVDFSRYDNDGDGRTEAISIVYAGQAETWGQGLWPHASGSNQKRNGVTISRYQMTNLGTSLGLYTFSHEVGHMLFGWPDLYGFGNYCIMGNGSSQKNPVGINDFYRADQGWIPIVDVTAATNARFTAQPNGAGYRYTNPKRPDESFFWSNVQSSGRFETISGDGLLLLHFDKAIGRNDPPSPLSLAVVQADGKKDLDQTMWPEPGSDAKDFFHGGGVKEFSEKFATSKWNDGSASELHIYDIGAISPAMEFKVGHGPIVEQPAGGTGGMGGAGGSAGAAGISGGGSSGGGAGAGAAANAGAGGSSAGAGSPGTGGTMAGMPGGGAGAATTSAGSPSAGQGPAAAPPSAAEEDASCGCRTSPSTGSASWLAVLVAGLAAQRRRGARAK